MEKRKFTKSKNEIKKNLKQKIYPSTVCASSNIPLIIHMLIHLLFKFVFIYYSYIEVGGHWPNE